MRKFITIIGLFISSIAFYELIGKNLLLVHKEMVHARYIYLLPSTVLLTLSVIVRAVRWHVLLDRKIAFRHSYHINNIGFLANSVLPFRLGDIVRAWLTAHLNLGVAGFAVLSSIVVERLLDLVALLTMLGLLLIVLDLPEEMMVVGIVVGIATLTAASALILLSRKPYWVINSLDKVVAKFSFLERLSLPVRLEHFVNGLSALRNLRMLLVTLFLTAVAWMFDLLAAYVILFMVFDTPTVAAVLAIMILLTLSIALPSVPGNLGTFQAAVVGGLWLSGMISSVSSPANIPAVTVGIYLQILTVGIYAVLGLVSLSAEGISVYQIITGLRGSSSKDKQQPTITDIS